MLYIDFPMDSQTLDSRTPLYRHVAARLREKYVDGQPAGFRLPSERELSQVLEVSMGTVRAALSTLESSGCIERRVGSGTYVLQRRPADSRHVAVLLEADVASPKLSPFFLKLFQETRLALSKLGIPSRPYLGHLRLGVEIGELTCSEFFDDLRLGRISGVISIFARAHASWVNELNQQAIPLVGSATSANIAVEVDAECMINEALGRFKARGCRHLAVVGLKLEPETSFRQRIKKIAPDYGIAVSDFFTSYDGMEASEGRGTIWRGFRKAWNDRATAPDCLMVSDDMLFPKVLKILREEKVTHLGQEQIVVTGSDAVELAADRPFTRYVYSVLLRARKLAEVMQSQLEEKPGALQTRIPYSVLRVGAADSLNLRDLHDLPPPPPATLFPHL